jgi:hypothetical protein
MITENTGTLPRPEQRQGRDEGERSSEESTGERTGDSPSANDTNAKESSTPFGEDRDLIRFQESHHLL